MRSKAQQRPTPLRRVAGFVVTAVLAALTAIAAFYLVGRMGAATRAVQLQRLQVEEPAPTRPAGRLRIAAWNIAHGRGLARSNWKGGNAEARNARLARIATVLLALDADIVILNEVDFDTTWSHRVNQASLLARATGFSHLVTQRNVDARIPFLRFEFGNGLLSRHPVRDAELLDYPALRPWEGWVAGYKRGVVATVQPSNASPLRVAAVHLEHRSEAARVVAAQQLLELSKRPGPPLVLAGDFNSTPDGYPGQKRDRKDRAALSLLLGSGRFHACTQIEPEPPWLTFRADKPSRLIDWVLLPPEFRFLGCQTLAIEASDHRPVLVELELPGADQSHLEQRAAPGG